MKWHIFQKETNYPIVWDGKVIEFDTAGDAYHFAVNYIGGKMDNLYFKECIFYYDGGYITFEEIRSMKKEEKMRGLCLS